MTNMIDIQLTIVLGNMKEESVSEFFFAKKYPESKFVKKKFRRKFFVRVFDTLYELRKKKVKMD